MTTAVELIPAIVALRIEQARRLTLQGHTAAVIAARLNVTERTVTRYRARARAGR